MLCLTCTMIAHPQLFIGIYRATIFCWILNTSLIFLTRHCQASKARLIKSEHTCRHIRIRCTRTCLYNEGDGKD
ncbi:unnamed protein product, partial [Vitis vinifera]|uniref:Uncharacterized protein n=1 Tax=Vitis vinifera TaxID=29760 RepID=D7SJB6_VITVI